MCGFHLLARQHPCSSFKSIPRLKALTVSHCLRSLYGGCVCMWPTVCKCLQKWDPKALRGQRQNCCFPPIVPVLQFWTTHYVRTLQCVLRWFAFGHRFCIFMVACQRMVALKKKISLLIHLFIRINRKKSHLFIPGIVKSCEKSLGTCEELRFYLFKSCGWLISWAAGG